MADPKDPTPPVVSGGPVEPEPVTPAKLVKVKYRDRETEVPEDVAAMWQEREREYEQRFSKQGAELGDLRRRVAQPPAEPRREEPREPDINTLWFENPQAAYQRIVSDVETRVESRYRQDQALKSFWDGFDRANDDLREERWLAESVLQENISELAELPTRKAQERLGDLTRERILRLTRKVKTPTNDDERPRLLTEPASGDRAPRPPARDADDDAPKSLSEVISRRRAARMGAAKGA